MAEGTERRQVSGGSQRQRGRAQGAQGTRGGQHQRQQPAGRGTPHRRVGGDTGTIPVIDSTGSLPNTSGYRVEKTVVMSRDEIRRVAEREEGSRVRPGSTAEMPVVPGRQRRHIPDSDRPVVVETTGRRHSREDVPRPRQRPVQEVARPASHVRAEAPRETTTQGRARRQGGTRQQAARPRQRPQARQQQASRRHVGQPGQPRPHARQDQGRPRSSQPQPRHVAPRQDVRRGQAQPPRRRPPEGRDRRRGGGRRRGGRLPVLLLVAALVVLVIVVVSVARCSAARSAAEAAQQQAQQEQEAQQQTQKATEIAGLPEGTYYLEPANTTAGVLAVDVSGVGDDAYTTLIATTMEQSAGQQIRLDVSDDGTTCTLSNGELYFDVGDVTAGSGRPVFANKASGGDSQNWKIEQNSDGTYCVVSAAADVALDVADVYSGAPVTADDYDSTSQGQRFQIVSERRAEELGTGTSTDTTDSTEDSETSTTDSGTDSAATTDDTTTDDTTL